MNSQVLQDVLKCQYNIVLDKITFPQIFEDDKYIGGYSKLSKIISEEDDIFSIEEEGF
jgi:glutaredoxin